MADRVASRWQARLAGQGEPWLALMLLALHAAIAWGIEAWWSRALLLAHFGLFLIWQPVWQAGNRLDARTTAAVVVIAVAFAAVLDWWWLAIWIALLFALIGGSSIGAAGQSRRLAARLAALYLLAMLLMWVVPQLFAEPGLPEAVAAVARYGLPLIPLAIILVPRSQGQPAPPPAVDFVYSLLLFLLVAALVLGSFVVKELSGGNYPMALAHTLLVIALVLLGLAWLWSPRAHFAGIGQLVSQHLLSLGLPFEQWLRRLARLAELERDPRRFLAGACEEMARLPWLAGVSWKAGDAQGIAGHASTHAQPFTVHGIELVLYTRFPGSPALALHARLLAQLVADFHDAKCREERERARAYLHAIHETGARVTHDVKNLLQSLEALCAAAQASGPGQAERLQTLLRRQLPEIARRLERTLAQLSAPAGGVPAGEPLAAGQWWQRLQRRYADRGIAFAALAPEAGAEVLPAELFDVVADNLLANALAKRRPGDAPHVEVALGAGPSLRVTDRGEALPPVLIERLFLGPVPSDRGLGIGLYQAAQLAGAAGWRLRLAGNEPGRVVFELVRAAAG